MEKVYLAIGVLGACAGIFFILRRVWRRPTNVDGTTGQSAAIDATAENRKSDQTQTIGSVGPGQPLIESGTPDKQVGHSVNNSEPPTPAVEVSGFAERHSLADLAREPDMPPASPTAPQTAVAQADTERGFPSDQSAETAENVVSQELLGERPDESAEADTTEPAVPDEESEGFAVKEPTRGRPDMSATEQPVEQRPVSLQDDGGREAGAVIDEDEGDIRGTGGQEELTAGSLPDSTNIEREEHTTEKTRAPRQYRVIPKSPTLRNGTTGTRTTQGDTEERERALPIEVRLVFQKAGFCRVTLLPRRQAALPDELGVSGHGTPSHLVALQEDWYQDIVVPEIGGMLRAGAEWSSSPVNGRTVHWSLSGREVFVLGPHSALSGFVSMPALVLGEQHVILCTADRLQDVQEAVKLAGSPEPTVFGENLGVPVGWLGLKGVIPSVAVPSSNTGDILDVLRPVAEVQIALEGGIRIDRTTWLAEYPPRIRVYGNVADAGQVVIDGVPVTITEDGSYIATGWDLPGEHQVWCPAATRTYRIEQGAEAWELWNAYTWSMGDFNSDGGVFGASICGTIVTPPKSARGSRLVFTATSNPILLGAEPGQIIRSAIRGDVQAPVCIGYPSFEPVWAVPSDLLNCNKRNTGILVLGSRSPVRSATNRSKRRDTKMVLAWCAAILNAGRKGLSPTPANAQTLSLWQEYKRCAKSLRRSLR